MNRRRFLGLTLGTGALVAGGLTWHGFSSEMDRARARLRGRSEVFDSRFGRMEYALAGEGAPLLVVHGMGGGFDQGIGWVPPEAATGWQVIAPSRFGYLRSDFPADPSLENQADAFVDLLDHLKIERVPVIGVSAGAQSSIQFAIRHPTRCAALVALVPAGYSPERAPPPVPIWTTRLVADLSLLTELLFWLGWSMDEDRMIETVLASDPALLRGASPSETARVHAILRNAMPIRERARGIANDARQAGWPAPLPLEQVHVPTLAISLADDRYDTLSAARHIAERVPGARLVDFPTGGHVWIGLNQKVLGTVNDFLNAAGKPPG